MATLTLCNRSISTAIGRQVAKLRVINKRFIRLLPCDTVKFPGLFLSIEAANLWFIKNGIH